MNALRYIYHDLVPEIRDGSNSNPRSFMIFVTRSLKLKCAFNNLKQILHVFDMRSIMASMLLYITL